MAFMIESQVYSLLSEVGMATPRYLRVNEKSDLSSKFKKDDEVVIKGLADELWHKSDIGAVVFTQYEKAWSTIETIKQNVLKNSKSWKEALVCEKVKFKSKSGLPSEGFVSLKKDRACGWVLYFGLGGLQAEQLAQEIKVLSIPLELFSADEIYSQVEKHFLGQLWLGQLRQVNAFTTKERFKKYIAQLLQLPKSLERENVEFIEMNPVVVSESGEILALDGVGVQHDKTSLEYKAKINTKSLLFPERMGIIGVSQKPDAVGTMIFENMLKSKVKELIVIKPGSPEFLGKPCVPDVSALLKKPLDILVVSLPAEKTLEVVEQLIKQGGGAEFLYLVAGGLGDGADEKGYGKKVLELLRKNRQEGKWTPVLIGPNGLGMLVANLELHTLFIPEDKLKVPFSSKSSVALISQSGAFLITRISKSNLELKYGFSIGNQIDMKMSDFIKTVVSDPQVKVIALYAEGFGDLDALDCARLIKENPKKRFVIYKGGRTAQGMAAAQGHTGAMASDAQLLEDMFKHAGAIIAKNFTEFNSIIDWLNVYPDLKFQSPVTVLTNAGYEAVGSGDFSLQAVRKLSEKERLDLNNAIKKNNLKGLVSAQLPLDLTPMANEQAWIDCLHVLSNSDEVERIVLGLVPMTKRLETDDEKKMIQFALELKKVGASKALAVVVDSGVEYNKYKSVFKSHGFCVFESMDQALVNS